jgi:geranylgeranyl pyrophosphate synthase
MVRLVGSIRQTNSVALAMQEATRHVDRALAVLGSIESGPERDALENLARFIIDRKL